ncbi:MAG: dehypoxanthine futalosine cyclase [candidate division NC10 bacterium]|nr:dehypoxanthine futalosine cyclase [candidate division NC10 bacterium]
MQREQDTALEPIVEKVLDGERLSSADGVSLFRSRDLLTLSFLADHVRQRKHPGNIVTYVIGRIVNYTNVCWVRCKFCAFYRPPGSPEGYVLSKDEIFGKIQELVDLGGTEVLIQGGLNPALGLSYYENLFASIKERFPVHIHGLSPTEILSIAKLAHLNVEETLKRLKAAGLGSIPGGGAEILVDEVRREIAPLKDKADEWLSVMRTAHRLGLPSSVTMMFGSVETIEQRVLHLLRIRALQDETGGFTAFIAWNYQPDGAELGGHRTSAFDYLRTVAVACLLLDNVENIQASWLTQGPKIAQIALRYGVNDLGSTILEERVVSAGGSGFMSSKGEMERVIREAGFIPKRRNTLYQWLD